MVEDMYKELTAVVRFEEETSGFEAGVGLRQWWQIAWRNCRRHCKNGIFRKHSLQMNLKKIKVL